MSALMSARPKRGYVTLRLVEDYWHLRPATCVKCGIVANTERCHVIDRAFGGLDHVANIVPLCHACHRDMPVFLPGQEPMALLWCFSGNLDRLAFVTHCAYALRGDEIVTDTDEALRATRETLAALYERGLIAPRPSRAVSAA